MILRTDEERFAIVKDARQRLREIPASKANAATLEGYEREVERLVGETGRDHMDLWAAACDTSSKRTYYRRLAAIRHCLRTNLELRLRLQDQLQRSGDKATWQVEIEHLAGLVELAAVIGGAEGSCPIQQARPRKSKRQTLRGLPLDWREQMLERFRTSKYLLPYVVQALSGCRPDELQNGVTVRRDTHNIEFVVLGSKVKETQGQPIRSIRYSTAGTHPLVVEILKHLPTEGSSVVDVANKDSYTSALRRVGRQIWPRRQSEITPYCLRHAAAADWKAHLSPEEVSSALGHAVDATASQYGQRQMSGGGGLCPSQIAAERPIKPTRRPIPGHGGVKPRR
ncbi:hypothetical protein ACI2VA_08645 [Ralstonia nicotianae]